MNNAMNNNNEMKNDKRTRYGGNKMNNGMNNKEVRLNANIQSDHLKHIKELYHLTEV